MQIHLVRHGRTDWNAERRVQGQMDSSLDETGRAEARALAPRLAALGLGAVYCSTSLRTRQTAELALGGSPPPVVFRDTLREIRLGVWEGRLWDELAEEAPEAVARFRAGVPDFAVDGAESRAALQRRGVAAIERIIEEAAAERVLVVSHGALLSAVLAHYAGVPIEHLVTLPALANCAHSLLEVEGAARRVGHVAGEPFERTAWAATARAVAAARAVERRDS